MPATDLDLVNDALSFLGEGTVLTDLGSNVEVAKVASRHLVRARDEVLSRFNWGCARQFDELELVETSDGSQAWYDQFNFSYRYPADCLVVRRFLTAQGVREATPEFYQTGADDDGKLIFCNVPEPARIEYTRRIEDPELIDPDLRTCVSLNLALYMARPLSADANKRAEVQGLYTRGLLAAMELRGNEQQRAERPAGKYRRARR